MFPVTVASWDLWTLYHKVTFDGVNKLILVNPDVTTLDIKTDIYSDWKEWAQAIPDNAVWEAALRAVGGDPTVSGEFAGDIYFLTNGWKLYLDLTKVKVTGVLFSDDYESAYYDYSGTIQYPILVSSIVTGSAQIANSDSISSSLNTIDQTTSSTKTTVESIDTKVDSINSTNTSILSKVLEVWQLMGLDLSNPKTITDTSITVNGITLSISQPDEDTTEVARQ